MHQSIRSLFINVFISPPTTRHLTRVSMISVLLHRRVSRLRLQLVRTTLNISRIRMIKRTTTMRHLHRHNSTIINRGRLTMTFNLPTMNNSNRRYLLSIKGNHRRNLLMNRHQLHMAFRNNLFHTAGSTRVRSKRYRQTWHVPHPEINQDWAFSQVKYSSTFNHRDGKQGPITTYSTRFNNYNRRVMAHLRSIKPPFRRLQKRSSKGIHQAMVNRRTRSDPHTIHSPQHFTRRSIR